MGRYYKYKCAECSFTKEFHTGGGFFSKEYFDKTKQLEDELRSEIVAGKHGDLIRRMFEDNGEKELHIDCSTDIFQCTHCWALIIARDKSIKRISADYSLDVQFSLKCPECKKRGRLRKHPDVIVCPECKKATLELEALGSWD